MKKKINAANEIHKTRVHLDDMHGAYVSTNLEKGKKMARQRSKRVTNSLGFLECNKLLTSFFWF